MCRRPIGCQRRRRAGHEHSPPLPRDHANPSVASEDAARSVRGVLWGRLVNEDIILWAAGVASVAAVVLLLAITGLVVAFGG